jgi:sterol desaturase/sphingolipid hydroxylase (fatty acid hydroxylase superfamily)
MPLFQLEHSRSSHIADCAFYGLAVLGLGTFVLWPGPGPQWPSTLALVAAGLCAWSAIEYALHRFVLHGVRPFSDWHVLHHQRPTALIGASTPLSAGLIVALVFVPAWAISTTDHAAAVTLGLVMGYFSYALTHHAVHHWRPDAGWLCSPWGSAVGAWLAERKRWHALHHHLGRPMCFGVTTSLWDRLLGSVPSKR